VALPPPRQHSGLDLLLPFSVLDGDYDWLSWKVIWLKHSKSNEPFETEINTGCTTTEMQASHWAFFWGHMSELQGGSSRSWASNFGRVRYHWASMVPNRSDTHNAQSANAKEGDNNTSNIILSGVHSCSKFQSIVQPGCIIILIHPVSQTGKQAQE
jgi:hypothetical protein